MSRVLGPRCVPQRVCLCIERGQTPGASYDDVSVSIAATKRLRALLTNIMIHRTQEEVYAQRSTSRRDYNVYVALNQEQKRQYDYVSAEMFASIGATDPGGPEIYRDIVVNDRNMQACSTVLPCLQKLRAICTHALVEDAFVEEDEGNHDEENCRHDSVVLVDKASIHHKRQQGVEDEISFDYDTDTLTPNVVTNTPSTKSRSHFNSHDVTVLTEPLRLLPFRRP